MQRLFIRIFLWFWLAMAAVAAALILTSPLFTRARPGVERWQREAENHLRMRMARFERHLENGEIHPRRDRDRRLPRSPDRDPGPQPPPPIFLFDTAGAPIGGPDPPEEVREFAGRVAAGGIERFERTGTFHLLGRPVTTAGGERYVLVAAMHRPPGLVDLLNPRALGWRILLLVLIAGGICFGLARSLTAPVTRLREAVRRLSGGDLSTRVAPPIAARRDEIGDLARDVDAMAARLELLLDAQRRLVRDVSHELRSPLARMGVALELARSAAGEPARPQLDRIEREAGRLENLIARLLTLSRLESGTGLSAPEPLDLAALVEAVAADARFEAAARDVAVIVEREGNLEMTGRPDLLSGAVENVVRNAVQFTAPGSRVGIRVEREGGDAIVRVVDQGPGVPEADLEKLFEPFFRVEEARSRDRGGAGLGLAIAARAVRLHHGSLQARNLPGGGLEVTLRLPADSGIP